MSRVDAMWESAGAPLNDTFFGVSVTYSRGTSSVTATAIPSVIAYETFSVDELPLNTVATWRQYLIAASALATLAPAGQVFRPKRADVIVETIGGVEQRFEVSPLPDKPAAEMQLGGARWLVRAKRVE